MLEVMVATFSIERRKIMRILGAKVILTPAAERGTGMVRRAEELAKKHGWFLNNNVERQGGGGLTMILDVLVTLLAGVSRGPQELSFAKTSSHSVDDGRWPRDAPRNARRP